MSALSAFLPPFSALILAESSDHSVSPFPGYTLSAASGWRVAETFPEVCQLGFSCTWRQRTPAVGTYAALSPPSRPQVKHHRFQPTQRESQESAFLGSPSVYLTPVDFDPHSLSTQRWETCVRRELHPLLDAAVDLPSQDPLASLLGHSASVAPF